MRRTWAVVERELRRFRRSPMLIVMSMIFPVVQLGVLGYAFGGNVKHLKVGVVDQDHGVPAVKVRELAAAASSGARTIDAIEYTDPGQALTDLRNGRINGVLTIPPEFSRRVLERNQPRIALIEDNTDNFVSVALAGTMRSEEHTSELQSQSNLVCRLLLEKKKKKKTKNKSQSDLANNSHN